MGCNKPDVILEILIINVVIMQVTCYFLLIKKK